MPAGAGSRRIPPPAASLAIIAAIFIGMFALDAFGVGRTVREGLGGFLIHLAPVHLLIATVVLAWRPGDER